MSIDPDLRWKLRIVHIREAVRNILEFTKGRTFEDFCIDRILRFAIERNLQIIGEAAKNVPDDVRQSYPDIPWRGMAKLRDKIVHDYDGLNHKQIWNIIQDEFPSLSLGLEIIPVKEEDLL